MDQIYLMIRSRLKYKYVYVVPTDSKAELEARSARVGDLALAAVTMVVG